MNIKLFYGCVLIEDAPIHDDMIDCTFVPESFLRERFQIQISRKELALLFNGTHEFVEVDDPTVNANLFEIRELPYHRQGCKTWDYLTSTR